MKKKIPLPPSVPLKKINVNNYSLFNYHVNKSTPLKIYYRCASSREYSCDATATLEIIENEAEFCEKNSHPHPPPAREAFSSKNIVEFVQKNISKTPAAIQMEFAKDTDIVPPLSKFQNAKTNINRSTFFIIIIVQLY
jgi:hypothetical protein